MKLKSTRQAEVRHRKNMQQIQRLINKFKDPDTTQEEREQIKQTFQKVIDFADKSDQSDSMFLKMVGKLNNNVNGR